jgi:hypothetical protein
MKSPPPVIDGLYVAAYAEVDAAVVFEQRRTLMVDGKWLGRVPNIAICREFDLPEYSLQYCDDRWESQGISAGYASVDKAKSAAERAYHGIRDKWIDAGMTCEEARAQYAAELRADACSFCGKSPPEVASMIGYSVRICDQCIRDFHAVIHERDPNS